ncbi:MAG: PKD domain-containing protein, partial [Bacteroidia bacterium]|nr:PKD domain-containing protein [Bacteroidia bacterium]
MKFLLTLMVALGLGLSLSLAQTCTIQVNGASCPGQPMNFTALTGGAGFVPVSYTWDFGDGSPLGAGQSVSHVFPYNTGATNYTVLLTILDTVGVNDTCTTTLNVPIQYGPQITATGTTFDPSFCLNVLPCGTTFSTTLTLNTGGLPGPFTWNWGDGTTTAGSITESHTYTSYGTFNVTVTAPGAACPSVIQPIQFYTRPNNPNISTPSQNYCEDETIDVQIDQSVVQCPGNLAYYVVYWDYNNDPLNQDTIYNTSITNLNIVYDLAYGQVCSPLYNFSTLFQREIRLFAVNPCTDFLNLDAYDANPVNMSVAAEPEFSVPAVSCLNLQPVTFTNQSCPNNVNQPLSYVWDFGDPASGANNTSTLVNPTHTYSAPGFYQVTLTASNANCGPRSITKTIEIRIPPTANLLASDTAGCAPLLIQYTNNALLPYNTYAWSSVPATGVTITPATGAAPAFTFTQTGTYFINLNITNTCGTANFKDTIRVVGRPILALAPLADTCGIVIYTPTLTSLADNGRPVTGISWSFGANANPSTGTGTAPGAITFTPAPGGSTVTISATATNACGNTTATASFVLNPGINLSAGIPDTICLGDTICLLPNVPGGFFTFGGVQDTLGCYSPASPGSYPVTYSVDSLGCQVSDTISFGVNALPVPLLSAAANDTSRCLGDTLILTVNLPGGNLTVAGSAGGTVSAVNPATFQYMAANAGTATLTYTYTDPAGCQGTDLLGVIVTPPPTLSVVPASGQYCFANTLEPLPTPVPTPAGGTLSGWSGPGVSGNQFNPSLAGVGTHILTQTYTDPNGCVSAVTYTAQVD